MNKFAYEARNEHGDLTTGVISAEGLDDAGRLLSERNLYVIRMAADESRGRKDTAPGRASRAEVAWFMSQLAVMVETGIRLSDALECLARQATKPQQRALLANISRSVQEGRSLSEAMSMHPGSFDASLTALIRASEMNGTMSRVLRTSATYLMNDLQVLRRIRAAVLYPVFMFVVCVLVTVFLLTVILPRFAGIFESRGRILPLPTRFLMSLSESLVVNWDLWLAGAIAVVVAGIVISRSALARRVRDYLTISLPILSGVFRPLYQYRTFRAMSVLLQTGVHLLDVMQIVQEIVSNSPYRDLWRQVEDQIQHGEHMIGPLLESDLIAEPVARMIDSGERSGRLGAVFAHLADFMEEEYNRAVRSATQFIEPAMILIMGGIIGFIAASLMLPLFQAGRVVAS